MGAHCGKPAAVAGAARGTLIHDECLLASLCMTNDARCKDHEKTRPRLGFFLNWLRGGSGRFLVHLPGLGFRGHFLLGLHVGFGFGSGSGWGGGGSNKGQGSQSAQEFLRGGVFFYG